MLNKKYEEVEKEFWDNVDKQIQSRIFEKEKSGETKMKREIEFRGKTAKGEWIYGFYLQEYQDNGQIKHYILRSWFDGTRVFKHKDMVIPETVGQYVGITDKNGKKVYVGDIIKANYNFYPYTVFVRECKVCIGDKNGNAIRPTTEALKHFECEVIGTVFDKGCDNE